MTRRRVVVLLEGASDVAAVRVLLGGGLYDTVELIDMRGVTNIRSWLRLLSEGAGEAHGVRRVLGLCDAPERAHVARGLAEVLRVSEADVAMEDLGFHICHVDLEDELIRAVGPARTLAELDALGLADRFGRFRRQQAWRDRPLAEQLRRFAGVASGRKALVAHALASALTPVAVPAPLAALVTHIDVAVADGTDGPPVRPFRPAG